MDKPCDMPGCNRKANIFIGGKASKSGQQWCNRCYDLLKGFTETKRHLNPVCPKGRKNK